MLSVHYNPSVLYAQNYLSRASNSVVSALEKMSTGFRINRASDDAAGLYVATKMNSQLRGLKQAQNNISNGLSILSMAVGAGRYYGFASKSQGSGGAGGEQCLF